MSQEYHSRASQPNSEHIMLFLPIILFPYALKVNLLFSQYA